MKVCILLFLALVFVMLCPASAYAQTSTVCFTPGLTAPECIIIPVNGTQFLIQHPTGPTLTVSVTDIGPIQCSGGNCGPGPCNNGEAHRWRVEADPQGVPFLTSYRVSFRVPGEICHCQTAGGALAANILQGCGTTLWVAEGGQFQTIVYLIDFLTPQGYGPSCPDAAPPNPEIESYLFPQIGTSFGVLLANASPGVPAVLILGFTQVSVPLVVFLPGSTCVLLAWFDLLMPPAVVSPSGTAGVTFPIPPMPTLVGANFYFQWGILDPGAPVNVAMTPGLSVVIV